MNADQPPRGTEPPPPPHLSPTARPSPIAAERPDAAPKPGDDAVRIAFHAAALLALLALLAYCVIWAPRRRASHESTASLATPCVVIPSHAKGIA